MAQWWKIYLPIQEIRVRSLGLEDPLEEDMATRSSILVWRIPWTEEPGGYSLGVPELDATEHMCALVATSSKSNIFMVFWVLCGGHLPWVARSSFFPQLCSIQFLQVIHTADSDFLWVTYLWHQVETIFCPFVIPVFLFLIFICSHPHFCY